MLKEKLNEQWREKLLGPGKTMTLRQALKAAGELAWSGVTITVFPIDRRRDEHFTVSIDGDVDGTGPEYWGYEKYETEEPFYEIPDPGEENPYQLEGMDINWDEEGWILDSADLGKVGIRLDILQAILSVAWEAHDVH